MFCTMKMPKKSLVVELFTQLCYSAIDFVLELFDFSRYFQHLALVVDFDFAETL